MAQASRRAHQVAGAGVDREDIYGVSEEECSEDKIGRGGGSSKDIAAEQTISKMMGGGTSLVSHERGKTSGYRSIFSDLGSGVAQIRSFNHSIRPAGWTS